MKKNSEVSVKKAVRTHQPTDNLTPFQPGQSGNLAGRPRKLVGTMTAMGYKLSEINDTILVMLAMTIKEVTQIVNTPESTILETTVAKALLSGIAKGSLYNIETVLSRAIGKPRESQEIKADINIKAFQVTIVKADVPFAANESEIKE